MSVLWPLVIGVAFGWLLDRAGLTRYERIVGVYRFTDLAVLKFLVAAIVVGAAAIQASLALGLTTVLPVTPTRLLADAVGGLLFGVGMASAGFCPGTIVAGAGVGRLDYLIPGGAGLVAGALAFGWTSPYFMPALAPVGDLGPTTIPAELGVSGWPVVVLLAEVAAIGLYAVERHTGRTHRADRAPAAVTRAPRAARPAPPDRAASARRGRARAPRPTPCRGATWRRTRAGDPVPPRR
jgi:uncharacterized membrane protein YedE/YeeE